MNSICATALQASTCRKLCGMQHNVAILWHGQVHANTPRVATLSECWCADCARPLDWSTNAAAWCCGLCQKRKEGAVLSMLPAPQAKDIYNCCKRSTDELAGAEAKQGPGGGIPGRQHCASMVESEQQALLVLPLRLTCTTDNDYVCHPAGCGIVSCWQLKRDCNACAVGGHQVHNTPCTAAHWSWLVA
jgi:hypothetical protein